MSKRTIFIILAASGCDLLAALVLNLVGDSHDVAPILVVLAALGSIVAAIGSTFHRAGEEQT